MAQASTSTEWRIHPTLLALVLAALAPTLCVLWFMTVAMRNERLAVQQRLTDVYLNHLASVQRKLTATWTLRQDALNSLTNDSPSEIFAIIVRSNLADAVILYDAAGKALYPSPVELTATNPSEEQPAWTQARELEFQKGDFSGAAAAYERLANSAADIHLRARALQAQAGCLLKAGRKDAAFQRLVALSIDPRFHNTMGTQGALVIPNIQLLILKLEKDHANDRFRGALTHLLQRLNDYADPHMSASQRRFLMQELRSFAVEDSALPTFKAEQLAAEYLELSLPIAKEPALQRSSLAGVWRWPRPDRTLVALYREDSLRSQWNTLLDELALPDVQVTVLAPGEPFSETKPFPPYEIGPAMPGWRLAMSFKGTDPFASASARQSRMYLWSGFLMVSVIATVSLLVARYVGAQMRLARLKDVLISTVTHELKTPLASMRALVDTLLAGRYRDQHQVQQYLELVAKENQRLSHLIENFLSFSRMERNKHKLKIEDVTIDTIVNDALASMQDRFESSHCRVEVSVAPDLPTIRADPEGLTTVLINLLDNAYKYTERNKHIRLRAYRDNGAVHLEVHDNGIGLTGREAKKIFERFYQVDQSLARKAGGCGLGLSIVQFIVQAHSGSVHVESEPGQGSTFTVRLPVSGPLSG